MFSSIFVSRALNNFPFVFIFRSLESSEKDKWPQVGLDFVQTVSDMLNWNSKIMQTTTGCVKAFALYQQYVKKDSSLYVLTNMIIALNELCQLRREFKIKIPFSDYIRVRKKNCLPVFPSEYL